MHLLREDISLKYSIGIDIQINIDRWCIYMPIYNPIDIGIDIQINIDRWCIYICLYITL